MARFHRRSCFPNAANCRQGKKKKEKKKKKQSERKRETGAAENIM